VRLDEAARAAGIELPPGSAATIQITGFAIDHRKVAPGNVFGAFPGSVVNGEDFIAAAVAAGAVAVVARPEAQVSNAGHFAPVHIKDASPRRAFARLAAQFYQPVPPAIVAVTGTNGKTSCVEMTRQLWRLAGMRAASIGTLGVTTPDESVSTGLTTPDIVTFLANMTGLAREGVTHVAYEASSHGLDQYRNEGLRVCAGAFTNLSRDHLDYHADMDAYFAAKMRLFDEVVAPDGVAVIWTDDAWSDRACEHARERGLRLFTVGRKAEGIRLLAQVPGQLGQVLELEHAGIRRKVALPLIGAYQAANALVAAGLALVSGTSPDQVFDAMARLQPVRGRLERAAISRAGAPVYVDYAHTPDALAAAIAALRPHVTGPGKILLVLGAGGDRDQGKRPQMGQVAAAQADIAIVTDDNPRGEDPARIRAMILAGASGGDVREIGDRRQAIAQAVALAGANDIVLIAGKGHEQGQIVGSGAAMRVLPFDDVMVAREAVGSAHTSEKDSAA
jgi:UDP-N-acetylmuramoyl-L-alanyl-D-glutamate--2,6-diaminopimelate ligase